LVNCGQERENTPCPKGFGKNGEKSTTDDAKNISHMRVCLKKKFIFG